MIFLSVFLIIFILSLILYNLHKEKLKSLDLHSSFLETFSINKKDIVNIKNGTITFFYLSKQSEKIKIKKFHPVNKKQAVRKLNEKSVLIESVFHPKPSPYFAVFTKEIRCPEEFLPHVKKEGLWQSWTMFANQRQGFGVCDKSEISFVNHKLLKYCPKKESFFEIDYFIPYQMSSKEEHLDLKKEATFSLEKLISCKKE